MDLDALALLLLLIHADGLMYQVENEEELQRLRLPVAAEEAVEYDVSVHDGGRLRVGELLVIEKLLHADQVEVSPHLLDIIESIVGR